jgi:exopolysaccharide biosynthesis polyprenyl glycosylphosphotransferase
MKSSASGFETLSESLPKMRPLIARLTWPLVWQWRMLIASLVVLDGLLVGAALRVAYWIRFELSLPFFELQVQPSIQRYQTLVAVSIPVWLLLVALLGGYHRRNLLGGVREYALLFNASTVWVLAMILAGFFGTFLVARGWLVLAWGLAFLFAAWGRFGVRRVIYGLRRVGWFLSPAIIVGAGPEGRILAEQLLSWSTSGLRLLGFVDDHVPDGTAVFGQLRVLSGLEGLDGLIQRHGVEELILATSAMTRDQIVSTFKRYGVADQINLRMSSGLFEIITTGLQVRELGTVPLVGVNKMRLTGIERFGKLALDYAITIPGLILLSPFLAAIVIAIKLDSPGPIIHRRRVMGARGRQFDAFKFRTMRLDGDAILQSRPDLQEELQLNHKLKDDPRVTRVGRILRRVSLDEVPQLINVLRREMSLVGPRMITPEEISKYNQWDLNLLTVQPGITGLWQVSGRSDVSYDERVRLDMYYIRNWTFWFDLQLLIRTIPAVLFGRGAY